MKIIVYVFKVFRKTIAEKNALGFVNVINSSSDLNIFITTKF